MLSNFRLSSYTSNRIKKPVPFRGTGIDRRRCRRGPGFIWISLVLLQWAAAVALGVGWGRSHSELLPAFLLGMIVLLLSRRDGNNRANAVTLVFVFLFFAHLLEFNFGLEVYRLRLVFRAIYYALILFILWQNHKNSPPSSIALTVLIVASGLPFTWTFTIEPILALYLPGLVLWTLLLGPLQIRMPPILGIALALFAAWATISFLSNATDLEASMAMLRLGMGVILCFIGSANSHARTHSAAKYGLVVSLAYLIWAIHSRGMIHGFDAVWQSKATSIGGLNTNDLAAVLLLYLPFLMNPFRRKVSGWMENIGIAAILLLVATLLFICKSRIVALSFFLFILLLLARSILRLPLKRYFSRNVMLASLILVALTLTVAVNLDFWQRLIGDQTLQARVLIWKASYLAILDRPFVGHGPDSFGAVAEHLTGIVKDSNTGGAQAVQDLLKQNNRIPSHSTILQPLQDFGIVGGAFPLTLFAVIIARSLSIIANQKKSTTRGPGWSFFLIAAVLLSFLFNGLFNYNLMITHIFFLFMLLCGMLFRSPHHGLSSPAPLASIYLTGLTLLVVFRLSAGMLTSNQTSLSHIAKPIESVPLRQHKGFFLQGE